MRYVKQNCYEINSMKYLITLKNYTDTCITIIIILRVSFCSDIWYCNILAYYLGNILAYYLDN